MPEGANPAAKLHIQKEIIVDKYFRTYNIPEYGREKSQEKQDAILNIDDIKIYCLLSQY